MQFFDLLYTSEPKNIVVRIMASIKERSSLTSAMGVQVRLVIIKQWWQMRFALKKSL
jgi:hypothetical protein